MSGHRNKKLLISFDRFQWTGVIGLVALLVIVGVFFVAHFQAATVAGDVNGDGRVNISDLSVMAANFDGVGKIRADGDVNFDHHVNISDLSILAAHWNSAIAPPAESDVPLSIDDTGTADVTVPLNAYLSSVPDDTIINFPANGRYRIEGTLVVSGKSSITINGNGATFFATTNGLAPPPPPGCQGTGPCNPNRGRMQWDFESDVNLLVHDTNVIGSATNPGVDGTYKVAYEAQHAYNIGSGTGITLDHVTAQNTWGDLVYIGGGGANVPAADVTVENSTLDAASRQCFSVVDAEHVLIQNNTIAQHFGCTRSLFDFEANSTTSIIADVTIYNNLLGRSHFYTFNNAGGGAIEHDITLDSNRMDGEIFGVNVLGFATARRSNYRITNNVGMDEHNQGSMIFKYVDGLVVSGNTQPFTSAPWPQRDYLGVQAPVWYQCSTAVVVSGNNFTPRPPGMPEFTAHACPAS